jgi:ribonuclease P protein component
LTHPGLSFPRAHRLARKQEFDVVLNDSAVRVRRSGLRAYARPNGRSHARLGIIIGRRQSPLAVERNRMKRLVRESFRLNAGRLGAVDVVVQVLTIAPSEETRANVAALWEEIRGTGVGHPDAAVG